MADRICLASISVDKDIFLHSNQLSFFFHYILFFTTFLPLRAIARLLRANVTCEVSGR
jgi:hypothetical protein